jgi:UDP-glucose 4-epimerase
MRILITGCGGFIGGSLGRAAAHAGHEVLGIARRSQPEADWPGKYLQLDVAQSDLSQVVSDFRPDVVFHGAGTASVGGSLAAPLDDLRAAVFTWANLLDAVRRSSARPLILFPSSAAVYGNPAVLPIHEDAPVAPISPYGFHKAACELLAQEYASCFGLRLVICRLFSVFGGRQRRLLVWDLFKQLDNPDPVVWLDGTGEESRDFLHAHNLTASMLALAAAAHGPDDGRPKVVNFGSGIETTVGDLARQLLVAAGSDKEIRCRRNPRPGDPKCWRADNSRLGSIVGGVRMEALSVGLAECVGAWRGKPTG